MVKVSLGQKVIAGELVVRLADVCGEWLYQGANVGVSHQHQSKR